MLPEISKLNIEAFLYLKVLLDTKQTHTQVIKSNPDSN